MKRSVPISERLLEEPKPFGVGEEEERTVTGDETCVFHYNSETKC